MSAAEQWPIEDATFPAEGDPAAQLAFAARYAVLAPSTHNTQPWRFVIHGDRLDLHADRTRGLPVADPRDRELVISCGAALFHLRAALHHFGRASVVELVPETVGDDVVATVWLGDRRTPTADDERLFAAIARRRTNRAAFARAEVDDATRMALVEAARHDGAWLDFASGVAKEALATLIAEADRQQMADAHFRRELASWLRPSERDHELAVGSPLLGVLGTDGDDDRDWLLAGTALARVLLQATAAGLAASFLNQPIELPDFRGRVSRVLEKSGYPQLLLRLGRPTVEAAPTPRRPWSDVIRVTE